MDKINPEALRDLITNVKYPIVIKNNCDWPLLKWSLDDWSKHVEDKELPFRCKPPKVSKEPCWERSCPVKNVLFKDFIESVNENKKVWSYFDYKYIHHWFKSENELLKQINWSSFGFPEAGASESTLWIGSEGAHTPCHQDTYGRNIVLQVYGRKRWLLFPPECGGLKPSRVPYEESSIYSQLNFYLPSNLTAFGGLSGCRMVVLEPGDALVVPYRWWHFVEHVSDVAITINTWIPCEFLDTETRVEEALTRLIVSQICKDLPAKCLPYILNPNEDDVGGIPLSVNILQLETTVTKCLELRSKRNNAKRIKLSDESSSNGNSVTCGKSTCDKNCKDSTKPMDLDKLIEECNNILVVKEISKNELVDILRENVIKYEEVEEKNETSSEDEEANVEMKCDHFSSAIIRAFCQPSVIETVKDNLLSNFH